MRRIRRFFKLSAHEKWLFLEAFFLVPRIRLYLALVPFRKIAASATKQTESDLSGNEQEAHLIAKTLQRLPASMTGKNRCLVLSLTGRKMLQARKLSSRLFLGVKHNEQKKLLAHAWLVHQDIEVFPKDDNYKILLDF